MTLVDGLIRVLDYLKGGNDVSHGTPARLLAAFWGSLVLHLAMLLNFLSDLPVSLTAVGTEFYLEVLVQVIPIYSAVFGWIIAIGVPKGSLLRHFAYGVLLPALAYALAGTLLDRGATDDTTITCVECSARPAVVINGDMP